MEDEPEYQEASPAHFVMSSEALKEVRSKLSPHDAAALEALEAALANLDLESTPEPSADRVAPLPAVMEWQEKHERELVANRPAIAAKSAAEERERYAAERAAEGKTVRGYVRREHAPQRPNESGAAYAKRIKLESEKARYAEKNGGKVRAYTDLSGMSDEEHRDHKRALANARQARKRAAAKQQKEAEALAAAEAIKAGRIV